MKGSLFSKLNCGITLVEVLVVIVALGLLVAVFLPKMAKSPSLRINCINNLKQVGLAFRVWEGDNGDNYPMTISGTNGGTKEFTTGPNAWRHFQIMSNELSTPKVVFCPDESDRDRICANTFGTKSLPDQIPFHSNSNLSYFVGVDANETNPAAFLAGDHNLTNGLSLENGVLEVTTNRSTGWTEAVHHKCGYVCLADGSVQLVYNTNLQALVEHSGVATNRLQMPVLGP